MKKPRLLYASPFPPKPSGISDYSVILVQALREFFDITLYSDDYDITDPALSSFPVLKYGKDEIDIDQYDDVIYNMGNSDMHGYIYKEALRHPGVVIMHDYVISHFICAHYHKANEKLYKKLYHLYKSFGISECVPFGIALMRHRLDDHFMALHPLNSELFKSGNRFLVHSEYIRNKIINTGFVDKKNVKKIGFIEQMGDDATIIHRDELFEKYHVPSNKTLICAFGLIWGNKLNVLTAQVVKRLHENGEKNISYLMVGQGNAADAELMDDVVMKTGFVTMDEFNSFVKYADIVVNLRSPTMGETSAALMRAMQMGKPCIINDGGWYSELPEDSIEKVDLRNPQESLETLLKTMLHDQDRCKRIGDNAKKYVHDFCGKKAVAGQIYDFLKDA